MKRILSFSSLFAVMVVMAIEFGCNNSVSSENGTKALNLSVTEKKVVSASGSFAFRLFREMAQQAGERNFFMSPLSVSMALAMTMNGAAGQTYDDMQSTLGLGSLTEDQINESYRNIASLFGNLDPNVKFTIANSIWYRNTFAVPETFLDVNKDYFDAEVKSLDFSDPGAVDEINSWVSDKTNAKIPKVLDPPISPDVIMYLINALYFNGTWQYQFDKSATKPLPFYLADGSRKDVETMAVHDTLKYYSDDKVSVVELPYGKGDYSMLIVLPSSSSSLESLTGELSQSRYQSILDGLRETDIQVELPRFTIRYDTLLNDPLKNLGMSVAFDPYEANFSRMKTAECRDTICISRVIHSTYINVNEEGTEAAAATVVEMYKSSIEGSPLLFKANRPFAFLIKENHENTIMFMGAVVDLGE